MPGGYGIYGPWGSAGTSYVSSGQSSSPYQPGGGSTNQGGSNAVADAVNAYQQNPTPQNQQVAQAVIAEQTPDPGYQTFEELADLAATDPKYKNSWDFNPDNPNNWIGYETQYNLGKFVATDSSGNPILDSSDNYILTGLGKYIKDQGQGSGINLENLQGIEKEYHSKRQAEQEQLEDQQQQQRQYGYFPDPGGGYRGRGYAYGDTEMFDTDVRNYWRDVAGTPMLPVAGSGAGASMAAADELYSLAAGNKAFSNTPAEQGILAILNA